MANNPPRMPKWTCPLIDQVVHGVENALDHVSDVDKDDPEGCYDACDSVRSELTGLEDIVEEIRTANSQLRACAEYWEEAHNELEIKLESLTSQLEEALSECNELREELNGHNE